MALLLRTLLRVLKNLIRLANLNKARNRYHERAALPIRVIGGFVFGRQSTLTSAPVSDVTLHALFVRPQLDYRSQLISVGQKRIRGPGFDRS